MTDYNRALDRFFVEPPEVQRVALDKILDGYARTARALRIALIVGAVNAVLLIAVSFKYLHAVNMPRERCLYPAFVPTQIEPARKPSDVEVWL